MGSSYNKSGGDRNALKLVKGKPTGKRHLGRLGVDGRTILELILNR